MTNTPAKCPDCPPHDGEDWSDACICPTCHGTGQVADTTEPHKPDELELILSYFGGRYHAAKSGNGGPGYGKQVLAEAKAEIARLTQEARIDELERYENWSIEQGDRAGWREHSEYITDRLAELNVKEIRE